MIMAIANGKYKGGQLSLTIDSVEYNMDLSSANFVSEDSESDTTTFADVGAGGAKDWFLDIEAVTDFGDGSLWAYVWDNAGDTDVAWLYKPYGNVAASTAQPHFSGTLTIPSEPNFGGAAGEDFTFEARFAIDGKPTKVSA